MEADTEFLEKIKMLPEELREKLVRGGSTCDGCGLVYFGKPVVTGRIPGMVAGAKVWLSVQYCSVKCADVHKASCSAAQEAVPS